MKSVRKLSPIVLLLIAILIVSSCGAVIWTIISRTTNGTTVKIISADFNFYSDVGCTTNLGNTLSFSWLLVNGSTVNLGGSSGTMFAKYSGSEIIDGTHPLYLTVTAIITAMPIANGLTFQLFTANGTTPNVWVLNNTQFSITTDTIGFNLKLGYNGVGNCSLGTFDMPLTWLVKKDVA